MPTIRTIARAVRHESPKIKGGCAVRGVLAAFELTPGRSAYGAEVHQEVPVPVEDLERLEAFLKDATRGRIRLETA